ncbi:hypothetical protein [Geodermatophilus sp. SYSU D01036]
MAPASLPAFSTAYAQVQFSLVWSAVVVVTAVSLVLYTLVQIVETIVLTRMGTTPREGA